MLGPEEYFTTGVFFMKKFGKDKIALFLACTSLLSDKASAMNMGKTQNQQPVAAVGGAISRNNQSVKQGLSKKQKFTIATIASILAVTAVGLTIWGVKKYLSSKDDPSKNKDNEYNNKKNNEDVKILKSVKKSEDDAKNLNEDSPKKVKTQEQIYDQNIEMIKKNSGLDEKIIDQLIKIMNNKDSISKHLDIITENLDQNDEKVYPKDDLDEEIISKFGLAAGNSWVEEFFDDLRKLKIREIEKVNDTEFRVYMNVYVSSNLDVNKNKWYSLAIHHGHFFDIRRVDTNKGVDIYDFEKLII